MRISNRNKNSSLARHRNGKSTATFRKDNQDISALGVGVKPHMEKPHADRTMYRDPKPNPYAQLQCGNKTRGPQQWKGGRAATAPTWIPADWSNFPVATPSFYIMWFPIRTQPDWSNPLFINFRPYIIGQTIASYGTVRHSYASELFFYCVRRQPCITFQWNLLEKTLSFKLERL